MSFSANPFDLTGTLDTSQPDGQATGFTTIPASPEAAGTSLGAIATATADNSAASVCPAFRDTSLAAHAANRVLPGQAIPSPSAP